MIAHKFTFGWNDGGIGITKSFEVTAGSALQLDEAIGANANAEQLNFAFQRSLLKGLFIVSDRDLTLKTNNSGDPDNTFNLAAGKPIVWVDGMQNLRDSNGAELGNVTSLFATNPSESAAATLRIRVLIEPTD
jgi:hypothetical protein